MASDSYDLIRGGILQGDLELGATLSSLDLLLTQGRITQDEYIELADLARETCDPAKSLPSDTDRIAALETQIADLATRVAKLEGKVSDTEAWPLWTKPTSVADYAHTGTRVSFDAAGDGTAEHYVCLLNKSQDASGDAFAPNVYKAHWHKMLDGEKYDEVVAAFKADPVHGWVETEKKTA